MVVTLGWMLLTGLSFPTYSPPHSTVRPTAVYSAAHRAGRVTVWTDRDDPYRRGEAARVYVSTESPAHVAVFRVDTDGRIRILFPREPWGDTFVRGRGALEVSGVRGGRSFVVDDYPGVGYLFAVASPEAFVFDDITRGDYWDYRLIDGGRLRGDPYPRLDELARRITRGHEHEYDIVPYYVGRHYDYPRFVCYDCHAYASYEEWDPYERACSRFRLVIYEDPRRYAYRTGGRNVVAPARPGSPRYLFRDTDARSEFVTRMPAAPAGDTRALDGGRTSLDIGGPGAVPAPGVPSLSRRGLREADDQPKVARPWVEDHRTRGGNAKPEAATDQSPDRLRPAEGDRRARPQRRPDESPQSTGEPELRRRKP